MGAKALVAAVNVPVKKVTFTHDGVIKAVFTDAQVPGKDGAAFFLLVTADKEGWKFWDKFGARIGRIAEPDAAKNVREDPKVEDGNVLWVKSFSCALFKEDDTTAAKLRAIAITSGTLKRCGGANQIGGKGGKGHESIVDADEAFEEAVAQFNGMGARWSVDASAGSLGISFASIVCAVFSSVALVFLVLFAAKRNSQLDVAVADE